MGCEKHSVRISIGNNCHCDYLDKFVEKRIKSGKFSNASEVVREGLRLLEQRDIEDKARIKWLRGEVRVGVDQLDRGEGTEFDSMNDLAEYIDQVGAKASAEITAERSGG